MLCCALRALLCPRSTLIHTYCAEAGGADADADGDAVLGAGRATFKSPGSFLGTLGIRTSDFPACQDDWGRLSSSPVLPSNELP